MKIKGKNIWIVPAYLIFYLVSFFWLEQMDVKHYVVQCSLDDKIPFCAYFIVPYLLWFVFVAATVAYFTLFNESVREYGRLIATLAAGMTTFLVVSYVCPNMHLLRETPTEPGIFHDAVRFLHRVDTSTNVFPSIHVFNAVACYLALKNNDKCRNKKGFMVGVQILTVSIVLSTMFLKQHSIIDVLGALVFNWICYGIFYKVIPKNEGMAAKILTREQIFTIPNALSLFRLILVILFWGISYRGYLPNQQIWLVTILCISGITDFLDGKIARKYNMISEVGKILDPIADKATQGVLLIHLLERYELLQLVVIIFVVKEFCMLTMGSKVLGEKQRNDGAQWYGKVNTTVFYVVMIVLTLFPNVPLYAANFMISMSACWMLYAFVRYMRFYREALSERRAD